MPRRSVAMPWHSLFRSNEVNLHSIETQRLLAEPLRGDAAQQDAARRKGWLVLMGIAAGFTLGLAVGALFGPAGAFAGCITGVVGGGMIGARQARAWAVRDRAAMAAAQAEDRVRQLEEAKVSGALDRWKDKDGDA